MNLTDLKTYGPEVKFPQAGKCLKRSRCGHQCGSEGSAQPRGTEERLKSDGISYLQAPGDMPGRTHRHWPAVTSMMAMGGGHLRGEAVSMSPPACSLPSPRRTPMCSPIPLCSCLQVGGAELSPIKSLTTQCVVCGVSILRGALRRDMPSPPSQVWPPEKHFRGPPGVSLCLFSKSFRNCGA